MHLHALPLAWIGTVIRHRVYAWRRGRIEADAQRRDRARVHIPRRRHGPEGGRRRRRHHRNECVHGQRALLFTPWSDSAWRPIWARGSAGPTSRSRISACTQTRLIAASALPIRFSAASDTRSVHASGSSVRCGPSARTAAISRAAVFDSTTYRTIDLLFGATYAF